MSNQERQRIIKDFTWPDWVELTEKVYGCCTRRHFPYTKKQKQQLLTKAHKLGFV